MQAPGLSPSNLVAGIFSSVVTFSLFVNLIAHTGELLSTAHSSAPEEKENECAIVV